MTRRDGSKAQPDCQPGQGERWVEGILPFLGDSAILYLLCNYSGTPDS